MSADPLPPPPYSQPSSESGSTRTGTGSLPRHVYYRVYSSDDVVRVKEPVSAEDPFLGGLLAVRIPPPHTAENLKRCLSKREGVPQDPRTQLFADISSLAPLGDKEPLDLLSQSGSGSGPENPLALVVHDLLPLSSAAPPSTPETSPISLPSALGGIPRPKGYDYKLRAISAYTSNIPNFAINIGDEFYTDGIPRRLNNETEIYFYRAQSIRGNFRDVTTPFVEFVGPYPQEAERFVRLRSGQASDCGSHASDSGSHASGSGGRASGSGGRASGGEPPKEKAPKKKSRFNFRR